MLKKIIFLLCTVIVLNSFVFYTSAQQSTSFSWYCKRNSNHLQPSCDWEMDFIHQYNGFYVDKKYKDSSEKAVYLTFDAGYENGNVEKILDILKQENINGSFFILEALLKNNGDLVVRMESEGNLICNHTATHKDISKLSYDEIKNELERLEKLYKNTTGKEMSKFFRPPEGRFSMESMKNVSELGYKTVFWSFAYADWDNSKQMSQEKAYEKVMSNIHNGAIILLHPTSETNVAILPKVIKELKKEGYSFKTLDSL